MSQWGVQRSKSTLSNIPEQLELNAHVYLMLIGTNAWALSNKFCQWSSEEFFTENGFKSVKARKKPSGSVNYLSDSPPMSCTVLVKKTEGSQESFPLGSPRDSVGNPQEPTPTSPRTGSDDGHTSIRSSAGRGHQRGSVRQSRARSSLRSSAGESSGRKSAFGGMLSSLGVGGRSGKQVSVVGDWDTNFPGHKAVKVYCFPVEHFSEAVPVCRNVDQWRALCMVFLLDPRQSENGDVLRDLAGRLGEVQRWVGNFIQASDIKSAPPQLQVVFQHHDFAGGESPEPTDKETAFVGRVRDVAQVPPSECIHHFCNLDDSKSFACRLTEVLANLIDNRQGDDYDFQPEFLNMLYRKEQEALEVEPSEQHPCCATM